MTRNAIALEMGSLVFRYASANGGDRQKAAERVVHETFPKLGERNRTFLVWALLDAETRYVRTERPALPAEGQPTRDPHGTSAPAGDSYSGDGQSHCDTQDTLAAPGSDDAEGGGHLARDTQSVTAPVSRRRLALARSSPEDYPVYVPHPVNERKRLGDLTKQDFGYLYGDARKRRRTQEAKESGWKRIYEAVPEGATFSEVMGELSATDRRFLADEVGVDEWRDAA